MPFTETAYVHISFLATSVRLCLRSWTGLSSCCLTYPYTLFVHGYDVSVFDPAHTPPSSLSFSLSCSCSVEHIVLVVRPCISNTNFTLFFSFLRRRPTLAACDDWYDLSRMSQRAQSLGVDPTAAAAAVDLFVNFSRAPQMNLSVDSPHSLHFVYVL